MRAMAGAPSVLRLFGFVQARHQLARSIDAAVLQARFVVERQHGSQIARRGCEERANRRVVDSADAVRARRRIGSLARRLRAAPRSTPPWRTCDGPSGSTCGRRARSARSTCSAPTITRNGASAATKKNAGCEPFSRCRCSSTMHEHHRHEGEAGAANTAPARPAVDRDEHHQAPASGDTQKRTLSARNVDQQRQEQRFRQDRGVEFADLRQHHRRDHDGDREPGAAGQPHDLAAEQRQRRAERGSAARRSRRARR